MAADTSSEAIPTSTVTDNSTSPVAPIPLPRQDWIELDTGSGWRQSDMVSKVAAGHKGSSSQLASIDDQIVKDQLFASNEMFDLLPLRV